MVSRCPGRERLQQRSDAAFLTVQSKAEQMVGEEPGRVDPVAGPKRVSNGLDELTVIGEPRCGLPVQVWHFLSQRSSQLQAEEVREKLVIAEPRPLGVKRNDECICVFEGQQRLLAA